MTSGVGPNGHLQAKNVVTLAIALSDINPYRSSFGDSSSAAETAARAFALTFFDLGWPLAFAANLPVPLMFSSEITRDTGSMGMAAAVALCLVAGWYVGRRNPWNAKRLVVGGGLVALSQVFPLLHVIVGMVGYEAARSLGGAQQQSDDTIGRITTEYGGFICTLVTGGALIAAALATGWLLVAVGGKVLDNQN